MDQTLMPLWFVLLCIGVGLYGIAWLIRDIYQTGYRHAQQCRWDRLTIEDRERIVWHALKTFEHLSRNSGKRQR